MKKMLLTATGPAYYRMCSTDVCYLKQWRSSKKILLSASCSGIGRERKTVDAAKGDGTQKMLLKQNPANIRKWIARFYYFGHFYTPLEARVYCSQ